jgi:hypothetical protein
MQIEKKLILCSILAISIGIAAIIPLQYLMNAEAALALPNVEPWFDVDIGYAECNPYIVGNGTATWDGATIQTVTNFTLTTNAMESDVDTQVEYYKFAVSSEQGPICDMGYYIAERRFTDANVAAADYAMKSGNYSALPRGTTLYANNTITFENGLSYNPPAINDGQSISWTGQAISWTGDNPVNNTYGVAGMRISAYNGEDSVYPVSPQIVAQLRDAQTLSIDVSKVCTVTAKGNVVVTTPADPTILQHIELTKVDNGFVYGEYVEGTLGWYFAGLYKTMP